MSRKNYRFEERERSAQDTALWMKADVMKAQAAGEPVVSIKIRDIVEVLAYIDSIKARDKIEYSGKHLGYCRPDDMRALLNHDRGGITVVAHRGEKFCCEVSFLELPPKEKVEPVKEIKEASPC